MISEPAESRLSAGEAVQGNLEATIAYPTEGINSKELGVGVDLPAIQRNEDNYDTLSMNGAEDRLLS